MKRTLSWLIFLELAYWVPARALNRYYYGDEITKEFIWTAMRLASAVAVYLCFKRVIWPAEEKCGSRFGWAVIVMGATFVAVPGLIEAWGLTSPAKWVFAATSLAVGLREEMVYRGVLQRVLAGRWGLPVALVLSNVIFIFYHYGSLPFTPWNVFQFFTAGMILGLIYHQTNSLVFVIMLHAGYDAVDSLTPLLPNPLSEWWGVAILLAVLAGLAGRQRFRIG